MHEVCPEESVTQRKVRRRPGRAQARKFLQGQEAAKQSGMYEVRFWAGQGARTSRSGFLFSNR